MESTGLLSALQMSRIKLWGRFYWGMFHSKLHKIPPDNAKIGTGLLTVVGISFATLSTAFAIFSALYADGTCPSTPGPNGTVIRGPCPDAYGMLLGMSRHYVHTTVYSPDSQEPQCFAPY